MTRRSELAGAQLHLTFANGKTDYLLVVTPPLMSAFARPRSSSDSADAQSQEATHRAAVYQHQVHNSVTARVGLLLQNAGADTAEDVLIEISVPARLQLSFVEQEAPLKVARKTPVVPLEPSPRSWRSDSDTTAHCRVVRVTSSVGLPLLFLTLQDPKDLGSYQLELKITAARPALEQTSRLTVQFAPPEA